MQNKNLLRLVKEKKGWKEVKKEGRRKKGRCMNIEDGGKKVGTKEGRKAEKLGGFSVKEGRKEAGLYLHLSDPLYVHIPSY